MRSCTLRLPGGCTSPETTVFAHAPSIAKGLGLKSPDWWGAYACSRCHDIVDQRVSHRIPQEVILDRWLKGIFETQSILHEEGILRLID